MNAETTTARLISIQVGIVRSFGDPAATEPFDKPWRSAIFKSPAAGPVRVGALGLEGDQQADRRFHGGPDQAVLAFSAEAYPDWRRAFVEAGVIPPERAEDPDSVPFGGFGENLTIQNQSDATVCVGDLYEIGPPGETGVLLEVSQPRQPCGTLAKRWRVKDMIERVKADGRAGWYLRVMREGVIEAGMDVRLIARPYPRWTIREVRRIMDARRAERALAEELAECPALSIEWRDRLFNPGA